jgi:hypothetical protein
MPTFSVDGNGATYTAREEDVGVFYAGAWGGGTLTIQTYGDDDAWHSTGLTATADGYTALKNAGGNDYRVVLSGSTSPTLWYEIR